MNADALMTSASPSTMTVRRAGVGLSSGPEGISNGHFLAETLLSTKVDYEMTAVRAIFDAGVATHWHTHPRGQFLFVLDGVGIVQRDGDEPVEVRPGDSVWFAPDERHWHGATPSGPFSYVSVQPVKDGVSVRWMEPVGLDYS